MRTPSRPRAALYRIGRWPCEAVCALRLRSEINKSYRDVKRLLFISAREFVYHAASHGQSVQLAGGNQE